MTDRYVVGQCWDLKTRKPYWRIYDNERDGKPIEWEHHEGEYQTKKEADDDAAQMNADYLHELLGGVPEQTERLPTFLSYDSHEEDEEIEF